MLEIVKFYFGIVGKIFSVYDSFEIFPGVTYFSFIMASLVLTILLSVIFLNVKEELDHKISLGVRARRANDLSDKRRELRGVNK